MVSINVKFYAIVISITLYSFTRMHNKLMFVMHQKCGRTMNQFNCDHSSVERALTGIWKMEVVRKTVGEVINSV